MTRSSLPAACRYFPLAHGKYEVAAGLRPLGTDFGNGGRDAKVFQFDAEFPRYRRVKEGGRAQRIEKYYPNHDEFMGEPMRAVTAWIMETLVREWPEYFQFGNRGSARFLECALTNERLFFSERHGLSAVHQNDRLFPYRDLFDALASQVQEDLVLWRRDPAGAPEGWLGAIHLCFPNHWSAEEKLNQPFKVVHQPVAGFQKLAKAAPSLVEMMVAKGPFVRFAWGVATDRELDHHPENEIKGRSFDTTDPVLELRIERQTLSPFPQIGASLFTIRTYFLDVAAEISQEEREALMSAIDSMAPESLAYKGLNGSKEAIQGWLASLR